MHKVLGNLSLWNRWGLSLGTLLFKNVNQSRKKTYGLFLSYDQIRLCLSSIEKRAVPVLNKAEKKKGFLTRKPNKSYLMYVLGTKFIFESEFFAFLNDLILTYWFLLNVSNTAKASLRTSGRHEITLRWRHTVLSLQYMFRMTNIHHQIKSNQVLIWRMIHR